jgi:hypothetical protein
VSNETGTNEVYVARFPTPGEITRVSPNGGQGPMWRRDGRELYWRGPGNALMALDVSVSNDAIRLSPPRELFTIPTVFLTTTRRQYAPSAEVSASSSTRTSRTPSRVPSS